MSAASDTDPLFLWLLVLAADALFAGLPGIRRVLAAPLAGVGRLTIWFDRRLNRERRSAVNRMIRGAIVVSALLAFAWTVGAAVQALARALPTGWLIEAAAVLSLIFQRRLVDAIRAVMGALGKGDLSAARNALALLAGQDTRALDEVAVARGAVESAATRFSDGVVGAAFWYLLLGLPGLCIFRTANVIAARIGHPTPRHAAFGATAARIDDVLALLPAAIAGGVLVLASLFVPAASPPRAAAGWIGDLGPRALSGGGRGRGAIAGALGLAPGDNGAGSGRTRATARDVGRAMLIVVVACLMAATAVAALALVVGAG